MLTTTLLWTLVAIGAWNGLNLAVRIIINEPSLRYSWSVIIGAWAALALALGARC